MVVFLKKYLYYTLDGSHFRTNIGYKNQVKEKSRVSAVTCKHRVTFLVNIGRGEALGWARKGPGVEDISWPFYVKVSPASLYTLNTFSIALT